jgi:hypothetical protein
MPDTELTITADYTDDRAQTDPALGHMGWSGGIDLQSVRIAGVDVQPHELPARVVAALENWIGENE